MGYSYIPGTPNYNARVRAPGQMLTIGLDYYTLTTAVNITPQAPGPFFDVPNLTAAEPVVPFSNAANSVFSNTTTFVPGSIPNDFSQDALDRLIEIISQRGQPIIMSAPTGPSANVYTFKFAIEHPSSWLAVGATSPVSPTSTPQSVPALIAAIASGGIDFGFDNTVTVTVANIF